MATNLQSLFKENTSNPYFAQANQYYSRLTDLLNDQSPYNPETDPVFQSYKAQYEQGAQQASNRAMADMNRRGILDSTITGDRLANIQQQANQQVQSLVPGLAANYQQQRQQQIANAFNMFNTLLGSGQREQQRQDANRQFEIATTGRYMPEGSQQLIQQLFDLKRQAEAPGVNKEQMAEFRRQGDQIRSQLKAMGINADELFGADVALSDAEKNVGRAYAPTASAQQAMLQTILNMGNIYGSLPSGTGQAAANLPLFSDLANYLSGLEGVPTMQSRQFDLSREKFNFDKTTEANRQAIQWANHNLNKIKAQQDEDYREYLKKEKLTEQQAQQATQGYITQILDEPTREAAMSYIVKKAKDIVADGAHIQSILNAIDSKFPRPRYEYDTDEPDEPDEPEESLAGKLNP